MYLWSKDLEIGIHSIDLQHKKMITSSVLVYDLLRHHDDYSVDFDEIYSILEELKQYAGYHLQTEEKLLLQYNDLNYYELKVEHNSFFEFYNTHYEKIEKNSKISLSNFAVKINLWIFEHIAYRTCVFKEH